MLKTSSYSEEKKNLNDQSIATGICKYLAILKSDLFFNVRILYKYPSLMLVNFAEWVIAIVVSIRGTVFKSQEKRLGQLKIRGKIKTFQTTANLLKYLKEFWRHEETYGHPESSKK